MAILWEAYVQCRGKWDTSELVLTLQHTTKNRRRGGRTWFSYQDLVDRHGQDIADEIVDHKSRDPVLKRCQVKPHPDLPRLNLYLCFDFEAEEEEDEDVLGHMASAVCKHVCEPRRRSKKRKGSSDSDHDSASSVSSSSSSSSEKTKKKKKDKKSKRDKKDRKGQSAKKPTAEQLERRAVEEKKKEQEKEERRKERENLREEKQKERELERKRQAVVRDAKKVWPLHVYACSDDMCKCVGLGNLINNNLCREGGIREMWFRFVMTCSGSWEFHQSRCVFGHHHSNQL